jgi:copper oxidase (laccase) domain-containing protein
MTTLLGEAAEAAEACGETGAYDVRLDEETVWLQAGKAAGVMTPRPELEPNWQAHRSEAIGVLGGLTAARHVVRMTSARPERAYYDLDREPVSDVRHTQGMITADPNLILHANSADCGELAVHGFSENVGATVMALIHANRQTVGEGLPEQTLEYLCNAYAVDPTNLRARLGPSARKESYVFEHVGASLQAPGWRDYVSENADGWHIDVHGRTLDDLQKFGVPERNITASPADTISDPAYFSHYRHTHDPAHEPEGYNGLFFAMRGSGEV